eukprot:scaffold533_cov369-Prasinococcus_capsulatus_cf.AAC.25
MVASGQHKLRLLVVKPRNATAEGEAWGELDDVVRATTWCAGCDPLAAAGEEQARIQLHAHPRFSGSTTSRCHESCGERWC